MYCRNCGTENPDSSAFCRKCGSRLNSASSPTYDASDRPQQTPVSSPGARGTVPSGQPKNQQEPKQRNYGKIIGGLVIAGLISALMKQCVRRASAEVIVERAVVSETVIALPDAQQTNDEGAPFKGQARIYAQVMPWSIQGQKPCESVVSNPLVVEVESVDSRGNLHGVIHEDGSLLGE